MGTLELVPWGWKNREILNLYKSIMCEVVKKITNRWIKLPEHLSLKHSRFL